MERWNGETFIFCVHVFYSSRTEEASQLIELVLTLFRNLLHIPDPINTRAVSDTRENMHDSLVLAFQKYVRECRELFT